MNPFIRGFFFSLIFTCLTANISTHERSRQILCNQGYSQFCADTTTLFDSTPPPELDSPEVQPQPTATTTQNKSSFGDTRSEFRSFKEHNFEMTGQEPAATERPQHSRNREDDRHETFDQRTAQSSPAPSLASATNPTVLEEMFIRMLTGDQENQSEKEKLLSVSHRRLKKLCWKYYPAAKVHCFRRRLKTKYKEKCGGYFEDCKRFLYPQNPLDEMSQAYQSNIRLQYYNQVVVPMYQQSATSYNFGNSNDNGSNRWYNENEWSPLG